MSAATGHTSIQDPKPIRRSFTAPVARPNNSATRFSDSIPAADGVETLFCHGLARIVLFTAITSPSRPASSASNILSVRDQDALGTVSWGSPTERTVAAGPVRIYRVPGSVAFLHSGSLLHPILPKSQCWCVDGVSKFALRKPAPNSYFRIEFPSDGDENLAKIEELKTVLDKILRYEKTPCPFTRGFHVEIPEAPETPRRRKRPVTPGRPKKWKLDGIWRPEEPVRPMSQGTEISSASDASPISVFSEVDRRASVCSTASAASSVAEDEIALDQKPMEKIRSQEGEKTVDAPASTRSFTAPANLPLATSNAPSLPPESTSNLSSEVASIASTAESFYATPNDSSTMVLEARPSSLYFDAASTRNELKSYLGESLDEARAGAERQENIRPIHHHRRELSELTITPDTRIDEDHPQAVTPTEDRTACAAGLERPASAASIPSLGNSSELDSAIDMSTAEVSPPPERIHLRRLTGTSNPGRRALSPMPPASNLFQPQGNKQSAKHMTSTLVQKTMGLLIGPPAQLVALMLRIAEKITKGFTADTWNLHKGRTIPGAWQLSDDDDDDDDMQDDWEDDHHEYGIPLRNLAESEAASDVD
ncbi:inheritance of peroxisomes protein 1-domain-containing protein [Phyllosticta citriasiana]|uniref:inheritance of peroxisomes protein 1-domain-containing protein n=1 Tax=Phyllosticta citriasiana TaxID=595635 RepID=UPI0030FD2ED9